MDGPRSPRRRIALVVACVGLGLLALALLPPFVRAPEPALPPATMPVASPSATAPPSASPTSAPAPTVQAQLDAGATASSQTITFELRGQIPAGASEAWLWYDTVAGHALRRVPLGGGPAIRASVTITPTQMGLTLTQPLAGGIDYWWAVRDSRGALTRRAGSIALPPALERLAQTAPITAPAQLTWVERATPHFRLLAPPGSPGARDLDRLGGVAEAGYARAASVITTTRPVSIAVYLAPRVFWQGGVAFGQGGPVVISYLDRNYAGVASWTYFVHEVTHALSGYALPRGAEVGGVLGEGVAVYATGGHYGPEPIDAWAATLAASDRYVPLCRLRYDFYAAQHEIAYQEAASFAGYLIRTYGQRTFQQIYAEQQAQRGNRGISVEQFCAEDNRRIVDPIGKRAETLEREWLAYLATLHPTDEQRRAWDLEIRFFDTMRRYQEKIDLPARDLPPPPNSWDRATAAKFLNAATGQRAAPLETMLGATLPAIQAGDLDHAGALLDAFDSALASPEAPQQPLARDYNAIVALLERQARALRLGDQAALEGTLAVPQLAAALPFATDDLLHDLRYTPVQLDTRGDTAEGIVQADGASLGGRQIERALYRARFVRSAGGWRLASWAPQTPQIELPPKGGAG